MELTYHGALVMPAHFVAVTGDEMEYIDGGVTYSAAQCRNIIVGLGVASGQVLMAMAASAAIISKVIKWVRRIGGPLAWILGIVASVVATAIGKIAYGIGYSAVSGRSVNINWSPAPWDAFVDVTWN